MTSLLVTNSHQLETNSYNIPPHTIRFHGVILRSASILNDYYNVVGHSVTINISGVNIPITLSDGFYNGEQYGEYLQKRLNAFSGSSGWLVYFNRPSLKYYIQYTAPSSGTTTLTFNTAMKSFLGFTSSTLTFPGSTGTITSFSSDNTVNPNI